MQFMVFLKSYFLEQVQEAFKLHVGSVHILWYEQQIKPFLGQLHVGNIRVHHHFMKFVRFQVLHIHSITKRSIECENYFNFALNIRYRIIIILLYIWLLCFGYFLRFFNMSCLQLIFIMLLFIRRIKLLFLIILLML